MGIGFVLQLLVNRQEQTDLGNAFGKGFLLRNRCPGIFQGSRCRIPGCDLSDLRGTVFFQRFFRRGIGLCPGQLGGDFFHFLFGLPKTDLQSGLSLAVLFQKLFQ